MSETIARTLRERIVNLMVVSTIASGEGRAGHD